MMVVDRMGSFPPYLCSVNDGCHCHQCLDRFIVSCVGLVAIVVKVDCSLTRFLEMLAGLRLRGENESYLKSSEYGVIKVLDVSTNVGPMFLEKFGDFDYAFVQRHLKGLHILADDVKILQETFEITRGSGHGAHSLLVELDHHLEDFQLLVCVTISVE